MVEFGLSGYVIHMVFLLHNVTQFGDKDKLVLRCVGNTLRRETFLFVGLVLVLPFKFRGQNLFMEGIM